MNGSVIERLVIELGIETNEQRAKEVSEALTSALKKVVVGTTAAAAAIAGYAMHVAEGIDVQDKLAQTVGSTAGEMAALERMAVAAGMTIEQYGMAVRFMDKSLREAVAGSQRQRDALAAVNLTAEELIDLPIDERLARLARAFDETGDRSAVAGAAFALLGEEAGPRMMPMILQGEAAFRAQREELVRLEEATDKANVRVQEWKTAQHEAGTSIAYMGAVLAEAVLPALISLAGLVSDAAVWIGDVLIPTLDAWAPVLMGVTGAVGGLGLALVAMNAKALVLAATNAILGTSFMTMAISVAESMALVFMSMGPIGWAIAGLGALGGALAAFQMKRKRDRERAETEAREAEARDAQSQSARAAVALPGATASGPVSTGDSGDDRRTVSDLGGMSRVVRQTAATAGAGAVSYSTIDQRNQSTRNTITIQADGYSPAEITRLVHSAMTREAAASLAHTKGSIR